MLIVWCDSLEDYEKQIACAKQVFYSALNHANIGYTTYLSKKTITLIEDEIEQHEQFFRMLLILRQLDLEHLY